MSRFDELEAFSNESLLHVFGDTVIVWNGTQKITLTGVKSSFVDRAEIATDSSVYREFDELVQFPLSELSSVDYLVLEVERDGKRFAVADYSVLANWVTLYLVKKP